MSEGRARKLRWRQPGVFRREWELVEGERVLARLRGTTTNLGKVEADLGGRACGIDWTGAANLRFHVRVTEASGAPVVTMDAGLGGAGTIAIPGGPRFTIGPERRLSSRWTLVEEGGASVASVHKTARFRHEATLALTYAAPRDAVLVPVLLVAWHAHLVAARGTWK